MSLIKETYIKSGITLVTLAKMPASTASLAQVFTAISDAGINIDMITKTPPYKDTSSVSFTIDDADLPKALTVVGKFQKDFPGMRTDVNSGNSKLLLFDKEMVETPGVGAKAFSKLAEGGIEVKLITTSDVDISILFDSGDEETVATLFGVK